MAVKSRALRSGRTQVKRTPVKRARAKTAQPGVIETALATFAHEVRTPLTGILAVSDLLATSELGERERRWVDTIKAGAEHLSGLATLFVDAARFGSAGLGLRDEFFDLRALAHHTGDSLAGRAAAKGLRATVTISPRLPAFVSGDAVRLRAALENLIDNAVKFTEHGDVGLKVGVVPAGAGKATAKDKVRIGFAVSDSGIGLSLAEIKRLFRPFSQANVTIATKFGGAGLGLSSVRQIARAMGGDVAIAQRPRGTVFTLTVTLQRAKPPRAAAADGGFVLRADGRRLRILSVEDNPFGRVVLNAILTELGHQTEFVGSGEAVTARLAQGGFDAVLMDMVLPGISGLEAIRQIRELPGPLGAIPIVGVSGRDQDEAAARAAGADAFLLKPVSPRALATALLAASRLPAAAT